MVPAGLRRTKLDPWVGEEVVGEEMAAVEMDVEEGGSPVSPPSVTPGHSLLC